MTAKRDPEVTSRIVAAVRQTGTKPELALRRAIHRRRLRYRVSMKLVSKPDLVFVTAQVACFVDRDRWQGNGWWARGYRSCNDEFNNANLRFWKAKIVRNIQRHRDDGATPGDLLACVQGWASEMERDVESVAENLESVVKAQVGLARR